MDRICLKKEKMTGFVKLIIFATVLTVLPSVGYAESYYFERAISTEYSVGISQKRISDTSDEQVYASGKMMKVNEKGTSSTQIIRVDRELVYDLNTSKKVYTERGLRTEDLMQNQEEIQSSMVDPQRNLGMQSAREKMLMSVTGVDAAQRSMMQQMMIQNQMKMMAERKLQEGTGKNMPVTIKWTNKTKKIKGYSCRHFKVAQGKKRLYEGWVTEQTGPQNYYSDFISANELITGDLVAALKKVAGFPMIEKYKVQSGQATGAIKTIQVTLIENRPITPFEFEIPSGYTQEGGGAAASNTAPQFEENNDDW
jgi:hypothetical protein